jgi:toxin CcdB
MAQFDVFRNPSADDEDGFPYLLVIQSDLLEQLNVRIVVPLVRAGVVDPPLPRLNPRFRINGESVVMATTLIGGLPARSLRDRIDNLTDQRREIIGAVDMLITGL